MAESYAQAVRNGAMQAGRLHRRLGTEETLTASGGSVDVFGAISALGVPLLLRPLRNLLGAFLNDPVPGILVTTERPMSIQRLTAAHELGHYGLDHRPSLDDETILRRMASSQLRSGDDFQEVEADAFAFAFMMPKWLILQICARQGWTVVDLQRPAVVYQLSLRLGASYEATYRTLRRYELIDQRAMRDLGAVEPRQIKIALLGDYKPTDYRGDVWLLTERDSGWQVDGSRNDVFVLRLREHAAGGYVWDRDELAASGYVVLRDHRDGDGGETVGSDVVRRIMGGVEAPYRGSLSITERRPWAPVPPLTTLSLGMDLTGPEEMGLSRAERRARLAA